MNTPTEPTSHDISGHRVALQLPGVLFDVTLTAARHRPRRTTATYR